MFLVGGGGEGRGRRFVWGGCVGREKGGLVVDGVEVNEGARRKVQRTYFWTPLPRPRLPKRFPCPRSSPPVRMFRVYVCVCVCEMLV